MQKDFGMNDSYMDVLGIKSNDRVLIFGNSVFPGLKEICDDVSAARKGSDLTRLVKEDETYERILVTKDIEISDVGMRKLVAMNKGLLCYFVGNKDDEDGVVNYLLHKHPWADVWCLDTNVGRVVVTSAKGAQEWLD